MTILVDPSSGIVEIHQLEIWCREFLASLLKWPLANRIFILKDPRTLVPYHPHVRIFVSPMNNSSLFTSPEIRPISQKGLVNPRYILFYDVYRLCDVFARVRKWSTDYEHVTHDGFQREWDLDLTPCLADRLPGELIAQVLLYLC